MNDLTLADIGGAVGGVTGVGVLARFAWAQLVKKSERADQDADNREQKRDERLEKMEGTLADIRTKLELLSQLDTQRATTVVEVKERIDGMSTNYGKRISDLEQRIAVLEAKGRRK